jgi:hypothetical protein
MITVEIDLAPLTRRLSTLEKTQIPFAAAKALNAVGLDIQARERENLRRTFTLRRPEWAERAVKITHFAKKTELYTTVAIAPPGDRGDILGKFETDTEKRSRTGGLVAVPINARRNKRDIIVGKQRPKAFHFQHQGGRIIGADGTFIVTLPSGQQLILQRKGRTKRSLRLGARQGPRPVVALYLLTPRVELRTPLHFVPTAREVVQRLFPPRWAEALAAALATAR